MEIEADIAPNPIQAKGISVKYPTEIKMTYEKVTVYLTLDSSFVHCYFKLHNEGKAENIQIGYPYMNTTPYNLSNSAFAPINVYQNGKKIDDINLLTTNSRSPKTDINSWYLWDSYFKKNETMVIEVSYSLPHGIVKNDLYYKFDYLLSTGAGWKGNIDTAEIIVNLKNFDKNLIIKTTPENYTFFGDQIIWNLYNIEPSVKDDISIKYEKKAGQYTERLKNSSLPLMLLDEKNILSYDIRHPNNVESLNPNDIAYIRVIKASEKVKLKLLDRDNSKDLVLIYSNKFIPERIIGILNSKMDGNKKEKIKLIPLSEFKGKYSLNINGENIKKENILNYILNIDEYKISQVLIKNSSQNKHQICILTNQ